MAQSARERAYQYLKGEIAGGGLPLGQFVTETEIANKIGLSRTPVREALHLLEQAGFVQIVAKKGIYIPHMSPQEIEDLWDARRLVETYAIERIIGKVDRPFFEGVANCLVEQEDAAKSNDANAFIEHDRSFHQRFVEAVGNTVVVDFYESLRDRQLRMGVQAVLVTPGRYESVVVEHRAIMAAVESGDRSAAIQAVVDHLDATRRATLPWRERGDGG